MKRQRHRMILEIVEHQAVETQEALSEELRKRGFDVTQATVSRDIKELRLFKVMGDDGVYRYAVAERSEQGLTERLRRVFAERLCFSRDCTHSSPSTRRISISRTTT